ncbi:MAG: RNA-binding cell elongation regulator Jag/EloR [Actinomycetota bacterium]
MANEIERTGPTVDEAVAAALEWLGASADEVDVEVLESGDEGGSAGAATVRVKVREGAAPASSSRDRSREGEAPEDLEAQADAVADFVDELLAKMDIDAIAEPNPQDGGHMYVDIVDGPEEDMALLIGRHGQTLEAIQELARMAVGRRLDQRVRVIVDVEDYRKRRESELIEDAREAALRVVAEGGEHAFDPMNAYERKLVHDAAADVEGAESFSRGEAPDRYVVLRRR